MLDFWDFLLQTLTVSLVAVLILIVKSLFKDKLPPKWHFLVWSVLGIIILWPAGINGRYTLFNWQFILSYIKALFGDYSFTRVEFPVPILNKVPNTLMEWIFAVYAVGMIFFIVKYIVSYIRLRLVLNKGNIPGEDTLSQILKVAKSQGVNIKKVVEVEGLPSAFVCGLLSPVLVIPRKDRIDDKIILHEVFHIKHKDTFWSMIICLLRSLHWCNPLIIYCANRAINDMEARCDQFVMEQLRGEERRDYGKILLDMTNERFAKTPGSTCINNGGKNIKDRIEAIARFKRYPVGMGIASICAIVILMSSVVAGAKSNIEFQSGTNLSIALAKARSIPCTTAREGFDAYGKAIMNYNLIYRVMCAPESMQEEIASKLQESSDGYLYETNWGFGIDSWPDNTVGYRIYNLQESNDGSWDGVFVIKLAYPPEGKTDEDGYMYIAHQRIKIEKEDFRWIVTELEDFNYMKVENQYLPTGDEVRIWEAE